MKLIVIAALLFCTSCSHYSYYVVRHAEKATVGSNMSSDVPLSDAGKARAEKIKELLAGKKIAAIYSTNTIRTKSTAQPTADLFNLPVQIYKPMPDSAFFSMLRSAKKNTLIVGHSNTVDDVVNGILGEKKVPGDLPDEEFNKLYEVRVKGKKMTFIEKTIYQ